MTNPALRRKRRTARCRTPEWRLDWIETSEILLENITKAQLVIKTPNGLMRSLSVAPSEFGSPKKLSRSIIDRVGEVPKDLGDVIKAIEAALAKGPTARAIVTHRSGWQRRAFVMPRRTIGGGRKDQNLRFDMERAERHPALGAVGLSRGDQVKWCEQVASIAKLSTILTTAMAAPFAATLLEFAGLPETLVLLLVGQSTSGKTLATLVVMSVQGKAGRDAIQTPEITDRGLEDLLTGFHGLMFPIDDLMRVPRGKLRSFLEKLTYHLTGLMGRTVADRSQKDGLTSEKSATIALVTSERSSRDIAEEAGVVRQLGEHARLFDLMVPPSVEGGIFDQRGDDERSPERLARELELAVTRHYGTALPAFIEWVQGQDRKRLRRRVRRRMRSFQDHVADGAQDIQRRAALKFGLFFAALTLARDAGVIPWSRTHIRNALATTFERAMTTASTTAPGGELVARLKRLLADDGRTARADDPEALKGRWFVIAGLSRQGRVELGLRADALRTAFPSALHRKALMAELKRQNLIVDIEAGKAWRPKIALAGGRTLRTELLPIAPALLE